jgi:hypothetical protein
LSFHLLDDLHVEVATNSTLVALRQEVQDGVHGTAWSVVDGLITRRGRVYLPPSLPTLQDVLAAVHGVSHEGTQKTLHRLRQTFFVPGAHGVVQDYVCSCSTCQRNKTEHLYPAGLLQPLQVPTDVWADVAMDFIEALPRVSGKSVILTVVVRFSKYAHFIPLGHPYMATMVAHGFFTNIVRLHGLLTSIVSECDPTFTSNFWSELFRLSSV